MERFTTYHCDVAVIMDKELLTPAMARLAAYEDTGLTPEEIMDGKLLTGWIPVDERLPEPHKDVLITFMDFGEGESVLIDSLEDNNGRLTWGTYNGATDRVLAWMPLPEPYTEDEP